MNINVMFTPHPPIIIDAIGKEEKEKARCTIEVMIYLGKEVAAIKPQTIIYISPHGNSFSNGTCLLADPVLEGDFSQFGHSEIRFRKETDLELTNRIFDCLEDRNLISVLMDQDLAKSYGIKANLDHGAMVPMYFIDMFYSEYKIVHITPGHTPLEENYFIGKLIKDMVDEETGGDPSKVLVIASGDLSHALLDSGPYAFHPNGPVFDDIMKEAIKRKDPLSLIHMTNDFVMGAAQCGLRSYLMGFGYFDGLNYDSKVLSYEGPFGVGYLTGFLRSNDVIISHSLTENRGLIKGNSELSNIETIKEISENRYMQRVAREDDYIRLARKTIEHYTKTSKKPRFGKELKPDDFTKGFINENSVKQAGVFVSLHKDGKLRGCIGTTTYTTDNVIEEIIYNAISACSSDPRFHRVEEDELKDLEISVDILMPSEKIESMKELDVKKYGVIVEQGYKRGLLLPNLDGIDDVNEQVSIAKQKAGIVSGKIEMYRFEVIRHEVV